MGTDKLIEYIPAVLILLSGLVVTLIILLKYGEKIFEREYKGTNILLFVTAFLFTVVLIVHLFREQNWTADTLKILVGVLVGAGSAKLNSKKKNSGSLVEIGGDFTGDVAGRDLYKSVQNIKDAVSKISDSIVHQNNKITQIAGDDGKNDFLINTIYERGKDMSIAMENVIQFWYAKGWILKNFSSDYHGMDGIFLIFIKSMKGSKPIVSYFHGSSTLKFVDPHFE